MKQRTRGSLNHLAHDYQPLESRQLLATFVVNTATDSASPVLDGLISLREAVIAANTNSAYGDAPAGSDSEMDFIEFSQQFANVHGTIRLRAGALPITDQVHFNGQAVTVPISIDARSQSRIFEIDSAGTVQFERLELLNGNAAYGGAMTIVDSDVRMGISISNSVATDGNGGAVFLSGGSLSTILSTFTNNVAVRGGAVALESGSSMDDVSSGFFDNFATHGGGGIASFDSTLELTTTTLMRNKTSANGNGGGILVSAGSIESNVLLIGKGVAAKGGAISIENGAAAIDSGTVFFENYATNGGGGVAISSSSVLFQGSGFEQNITSATGNSGGGGLFVDGSSEVVISADTYFTKNRATRGNGGGVFSKSTGTLDLEGRAPISFSDNSAARNGGGIHLSGGTLNSNVVSLEFEGNLAKRNGGAISLVAGVSAQLENSFFNKNNIAGESGRERFGLGGAIYSANTDLLITGEFRVLGQAYHAGGSIALLGGTLDIQGPIENANDLLDQPQNSSEYQIEGTIIYEPSTGQLVAKAGGGIYAKGAKVSISGVRARAFHGMESERGGVAFFASSQVEIFNSNFAGSAKVGGAIYSTNDTNLKIESSVISGSAERGGGVFAATGTLTVIEKSTVLDGSAKVGAGVFNQGRVVISESNFMANIAKDSSANNTMSHGGGLYSSGFAVIEHSALSNNGADHGGAIAGPGFLSVTNSLFDANNASGGSGGAISSSADQLNLKNVRFTRNHARAGGAVSFAGGTLIGRQLLFGGTAGQAGETAGNFAESDTDGQRGVGGALRLVGNATAAISASSFLGNVASNSGGAIALVGNQSGTPSLMLRDYSSVRDNVVDGVSGVGTGGGIANFGGDLDLRDTLFAQNYVDGRGGGIFQVKGDGTASLRSVQLLDNRASQTGGAIFNGADMAIYDSIVIGNFAEFSGGGIFQSPDADTRVVRTTIEGNSP